jgi:hypothetical protein
MFLQKCKEKQFFFCGHNILVEDVFLIKLSNNAGIAILQIVGVATNFCFKSELVCNLGFGFW